MRIEYFKEIIVCTIVERMKQTPVAKSSLDATSSTTMNMDELTEFVDHVIMCVNSIKVSNVIYHHYFYCHGTFYQCKFCFVETYRKKPLP